MIYRKVKTHVSTTQVKKYNNAISLKVHFCHLQITTLNYSINENNCPDLNGTLCLVFFVAFPLKHVTY